MKNTGGQSTVIQLTEITNSWLKYSLALSLCLNNYKISE